MTWIVGNIAGDNKISALLWSPGILSSSTFEIYLPEWAHIHRVEKSLDERVGPAVLPHVVRHRQGGTQKNKHFCSFGG
jgi:hypothetical protein